MTFKTTALLVGAFLVSSCSINDRFSKDFIGEYPDTLCVIGFTTTSENKGTLGLYFGTKPAIVEDIKDVSFEAAEHIAQKIGLCSETLS